MKIGFNFTETLARIGRGMRERMAEGRGGEISLLPLELPPTENNAGKFQFQNANSLRIYILPHISNSPKSFANRPFSLIKKAY